MERTNFENLRVYQLAEQLADATCMMPWPGGALFARDTVGRQLFAQPTALAQTPQKGQVAAAERDNRRFVA